MAFFLFSYVATGVGGGGREGETEAMSRTKRYAPTDGYTLSQTGYYFVLLQRLLSCQTGGIRATGTLR